VLKLSARVHVYTCVTCACLSESVVSARQQRISVMGGLESTSGAFGSNTSINSAVLDTGNRKGKVETRFIHVHS